jgi:pentose-5-phosphate-3-epimerase/broad specificity phosphatase PhoE/putative flippase GtrA
MEIGFHMKKQFRELVLFCLIGGTSTILNYGVFVLLIQVGVYYLLSSAIGFLTGVAFSFPLNSKYTFNQKDSITVRKFFKYLGVYLISLVVCLFFLHSLVTLGLNVYGSNILTVILGTTINFIGIKYLLFNSGNTNKLIKYLIFRYRYLMRYIIIGFLSLLVEIIIIRLCNSLSQASPSTQLIYTLFGFICGVIFAWYLNSHINFPVSKEQNIRVFKFFILISFFTYSLNIFLMNFLFFISVFQSYGTARFFTAACIFMISYTLHRHITFNFVKNVGVAIYAIPSEDIRLIRTKIASFPDFIHIDLIDHTYNEHALQPDVDVIGEICTEWPFTLKMIHIMSSRPKEWILKTHHYVDYIIIHHEIEENIDEDLQLIRDLKKKPGISIFCTTELEKIEPFMQTVDIIQILGITKPGCSGQQLEMKAIERLNELDHYRKQYHFDICFDGGVKVTNISLINAQYVVSASGILNAVDPINAILNLKTTSHYYSDFEQDLRVYIIKEIQAIASSVQYIRAGNIVGSFERSSDLSGISDIDIVIIVDTLNEEKFSGIINHFKDFGEKIRSNYGYEYIINSTFGPLKFNKEKTIVFHVMIYDYDGHKRHCIKSPFTCMDWQLSTIVLKKPVSDIFSVQMLMPCDFFSSRRGIIDYLQDIENGSISYREYQFVNGNPSEVKMQKEMEDKDKFDFSYHIMKFCMKNFAKLYYGLNADYPLEKNLNIYFSVFPKNRSEYKQYFEQIQKYKITNKYPLWNIGNTQIIQRFLSDFQEQFNQKYNTNSLHMFFIRHLPTDMNRESVFIGSRSNPEIITPSDEDIALIRSFIRTNPIKKIFTSPLRRAFKTASFYRVHGNLDQCTTDIRLSEINYGLLDGVPVSDVGKKFPDMVKSWINHEDIRFPEGENNSDVKCRLKAFLDKIQKEWDSTPGNYLICTHNVVIRCLIGDWLNIPCHLWHRIKIPHNRPVECIITQEKRFYLNLPVEQREEFLKDILPGE